MEHVIEDGAVKIINASEKVNAYRDHPYGGRKMAPGKLPLMCPQSSHGVEQMIMIKESISEG